MTLTLYIVNIYCKLLYITMKWLELLENKSTFFEIYIKHNIATFYTIQLDLHPVIIGLPLGEVVLLNGEWTRYYILSVRLITAVYVVTTPCYLDYSGGKLNNLTAFLYSTTVVEFSIRSMASLLQYHLLDVTYKGNSQGIWVSISSQCRSNRTYIFFKHFSSNMFLFFWMIPKLFTVSEKRVFLQKRLNQFFFKVTWPKSKLFIK